MVDVLGRAYGWSYNQITEEMYWEQVYDMYEFAANMNVIEWNNEHHFQLALHATTKEALNSWKDRAIPFPDRRWLAEAERKKEADKNENPLKGLKQSFRRVAQTAPMTEAQRKRRDYVRARQKEHATKVQEARSKNLRAKYTK